MLKNKILNSILFTLLIMFFIGFSPVKASCKNESFPDNVKITSSPNGSNTIIQVDSKPGFTTNVKSSCINGKCINSATSKALTSEDIKKMQEDIKKQQEVIDNFWKIQSELFDQEQKMFDSLWSVNF